MSNTTNTPSVKAKITWINANAADARKATASVTIGDAFQVHGISVFQGKNGTFLSMPQRQVTDKNGQKKFVDIAHPVTAEMRKAITDTVLNAYSQKMGMANEASYQTESGDAQSSPSSGDANDEDSLPEEILPPDDTEEDMDMDESFAPIMGQMS